MSDQQQQQQQQQQRQGTNNSLQQRAQSQQSHPNNHPSSPQHHHRERANHPPTYHSRGNSLQRRTLGTEEEEEEPTGEEVRQIPKKLGLQALMDLSPEKWKNIPSVVQNGVKTLIQFCYNNTYYSNEQYQRHDEYRHKNNEKIKRLEMDLQKKDEKWEILIHKMEKNIAQAFNKFRVDIENQMQKSLYRVEESNVELAKKVEMFNIKLSKVDETEHVKEWMLELLEKKVQMLQREISFKIQPVNTKVDGILEDHLALAGFIGPKEKFSSIIALLWDLYPSFNKFRDEVTTKLETITSNHTNLNSDYTLFSTSLVPDQLKLLEEKDNQILEQLKNLDKKTLQELIPQNRLAFDQFKEENEKARIDLKVKIELVDTQIKQLSGRQDKNLSQINQNKAELERSLDTYKQIITEFNTQNSRALERLKKNIVETDRHLSEKFRILENQIEKQRKMIGNAYSDQQTTPIVQNEGDRSSAVRSNTRQSNMSNDGIPNFDFEKRLQEKMMENGNGPGVSTKLQHTPEELKRENIHEIDQQSEENENQLQEVLKLKLEGQNEQQVVDYQERMPQETHDNSDQREHPPPLQVPQRKNKHQVDNSEIIFESEKEQLKSFLEEQTPENIIRKKTIISAKNLEQTSSSDQQVFEQEDIVKKMIQMQKQLNENSILVTQCFQILQSVLQNPNDKQKGVGTPISAITPLLEQNVGNTFVGTTQYNPLQDQSIGKSQFSQGIRGVSFIQGSGGNPIDLMKMPKSKISNSNIIQHVDMKKTRTTHHSPKENMTESSFLAEMKPQYISKGGAGINTLQTDSDHQFFQEKPSAGQSKQNRSTHQNTIRSFGNQIEKTQSQLLEFTQQNQEINHDLNVVMNKPGRDPQFNSVQQIDKPDSRKKGQRIASQNQSLNLSGAGDSTLPPLSKLDNLQVENQFDVKMNAKKRLTTVIPEEQQMNLGAGNAGGMRTPKIQPISVQYEKIKGFDKSARNTRAKQYNASPPK